MKLRMRIYIYILELNMSPSGDSEADQSFEACVQGGLSGGLIRSQSGLSGGLSVPRVAL